MKNLLFLVVILVLSTSVYAQRNNNSNYWNTWEYTAKEGMNQKFMDAAAKKTKMFNGTAENAMATYRVITGRNTGSFLKQPQRRRQKVLI